MAGGRSPSWRWANRARRTRAGCPWLAATSSARTCCWRLQRSAAARPGGQATEISKNKSSGWKLGVGIGANEGGSGVGINVFANAYLGNGQGQRHDPPRDPGQRATGDADLGPRHPDRRRAGARTRSAPTSARPDSPASRTAIATSRQTQVNAGGSFSFGSMTGNAYIGASQNKTKSNFDSVIEQTGLYAGAQGFDINVGRHTQLNGAVIASEAPAARNRLSTETLGFSDIRTKPPTRPPPPASTWACRAPSTRKQGRRGGRIAVRPELRQHSAAPRARRGPRWRKARSRSARTLNGRDSTAGLSRDTAGANGSIGKIFDKDKVREKLEFQQALGQLGMQIAGDALKDLAKQDPETWGEGKIGSIALHAGVAGAAAALGGATWRARSPVRWRVTWPRAPCASRSIARWPTSRRNCGDGRRLILNTVAAAAGAGGRRERSRRGGGCEHVQPAAARRRRRVDPQESINLRGAPGDQHRDAKPSSLDRRSARRIRRRQSGLRRTAAHEHFLPRSPWACGLGLRVLRRQGRR